MIVHVRSTSLALGLLLASSVTMADPFAPAASGRLTPEEVAALQQQQLQTQNELAVQGLSDTVAESGSASPLSKGQMPAVTSPWVPRVEVKTKETRQRTARKADVLPGLEPGKKLPTVLRTQPGVNEIVKVAKDYPSLIVTPFDKPSVIENQGIKHLTAGRNVYIYPTKNNQPAAVFIADESGAGPVVSLTLVPMDLPAQNILIEIEGFKTGAATEIGEERQAKNDYMSAMVDVLREVAVEKVPAGYTVSQIRDVEASMGPVAAIPTRRYDGTDREIIQYRLENRGSQSVTLSEPSFYSKGVRAIALIPKIHLAPAEQTTLLILRDKIVEEGGQ